MAIIVRRLNIPGPAPISSGVSSVGKYMKSFISTDWVASGADKVLVVLASEHSKGMTPIVDVYRDTTSTFEEVEVHITVNSSGDITLHIPTSNEFNGKVVII